jgi:class 3 adenylate cyclase
MLMTDIEASTSLHRELGDGYAALLEGHHSTLRCCVEDLGGVEIFNAGDGLAFLFSTSADAVAAAARLQDRLAGGRVRVRAAIHAGAVVMTAVGPVGIVLHECARLLAAASGGQVLVSPAARALCRPPPEGVVFVEVGSCRLRDVPDPWTVAEAVSEGRSRSARYAPLRFWRCPRRGRPSSAGSWSSTGWSPPALPGGW